MIKLTTTQLSILTSADGREDGLSVRPTTLKPAAAAKAAAKLLEQGLVRELRAKGDMPIWREDEDGKRFSLKIMKAGRAAVHAMAPTSAEDQGSPLRSAAEEARASKTEQNGRSGHVTDPKAGKPGSKRALILDLLHRKDGATIHALMDATGWLPHTTRAALTGLRKSGFPVERRYDEAVGVSIYRIESATIAAAS